MSLTPPQRSLYRLLRSAREQGNVVSADEIQSLTGWRSSTVRNYLSKKLRPYLEELEAGRYRVVGPLPQSDEEFARLMSQVESRSPGSESDWVATIQELNPWWRNESAQSELPQRRWIFARLLKAFRSGLGAVTVLRGPRRVGKTVLLRQVIGALQADGVRPQAIFYVPFDDLPSLQSPEIILTLTRWFLHHIHASKEVAYLVFDEVQNLEYWAAQIKHLADNFPVRILVTGSSSLRIQAEIDRLAGRLNTLDLGPLLPREICWIQRRAVEPPFWEDNGQSRILTAEFWDEAKRLCLSQLSTLSDAFDVFSRRGGYPIAIQRADASWSEVAEWLRENVVVRALEHDLVTLGWRDRSEIGFYYEILRLACRYAGQSPKLSTMRQELRVVLGDHVKEAEIQQGLDFLEGARLLRRIRPLEFRAAGVSEAAKICLCDLSLRAAWLNEAVSLTDDQGPLIGWLAESAVGAMLSGIAGIELNTYASGREVDFVVTVGSGRIPIEVKYQSTIDPRRDIRGLQEFFQRFPEAPLGLLITRYLVEVEDPRIVSIPLAWFLWLR